MVAASGRRETGVVLVDSGQADPALVDELEDVSPSLQTEGAVCSLHVPRGQFHVGVLVLNGLL